MSYQRHARSVKSRDFRPLVLTCGGRSMPQPPAEMAQRRGGTGVAVSRAP
jgi:hypothetical protein